MDEVPKKIRRVENAISRVENTRHQLFENAKEVKNTVSSNFSRQMESVRNREVFLNNQIDLIVNSKEEILHQQQKRLHKLLGRLTSDAACLVSFEDIEMDLKPEETPHITFCADSSVLRENIMNYGRIDPNYFPVMSLRENKTPSACLPPQFEDYDDAEHHVLYKTVEEVKQLQANANEALQFPQLSSKTEDWLVHSTTTTMSTSEYKFTFPLLSSRQNDWLKSSGATSVSDSSVRPVMSVLSPGQSVSSATSSVGSVSSVGSFPKPASVNKWLQQIKQNPDMEEEEEDFEVVEANGSVGMVVEEDVDFKHISIVPPTYEPKNWSCSSNADSEVSWLYDDGSNLKITKDDENMTLCNQIFTHQDDDMSQWLLQDQEKADCSKDGCCSKRNLPLEIENLGDMFADKIWLKSDTKEETSLPGSELQWLCRANEPCHNLSECVGTPNCLKHHQDNAIPLATCSNDLPGFAVFKHSATDCKKWLLHGGKNVESTTKYSTSGLGFIHFSKASTELSHWLKKSGHSDNQQEDVFTSLEFPPANLDDNQWLKLDGGKELPESTTEYVTCPTWENVLQQHKNVDTWLLADKTEPTVELPSISPLSLKLQTCL